jgi:hypothetical protein
MANHVHLWQWSDRSGDDRCGIVSQQLPRKIADNSPARIRAG